MGVTPPISDKQAMLNARKEARIQASQPTPVKPVAQTTPTVQTPQTIQQPAWNYGTASQPVYNQPASTVAPSTPTVKPVTPVAPVTTQPTTAPKTIVAPQGYVNRDTSIIGQELKIAQDQGLTGQNAAEQARILNKTPVSPTGATGATGATGSTTGTTGMTGTAGGNVPTTPTTPQTTQTGPATIDDATFNSILSSIDPNGLYTQDQKNDLRNALAQGREGIDLATTTAEQKLGAYQNLANAWRMQRDITDQLDQANIMNQRQVQDLTRQYNQAIDQQKQRMEADANNTSIMQGSAGRLQSRNALNAVSQVLDNNKKVYNDLISQKDIMTKRLAEDLDMATKTLSKAYNDAVSQTMQDALKGINALDTTGAMNTKAGLIQARSYIDSILQNNLQNLTNYYGGLQTINKQYQAYHQEYLDQQKALKDEKMARQTVDIEITNNNADGYAYNKFGEKVVGESGIPVTYTANKQIQNVIDNGDGTSTFIYKNGTYETKQLGATVGQEAIQGYAQMIASGRLNIGDVPASIRANVVQIASQLPQAGEWEFKEIKDENGNSVTVRYNKNTNEVVDAMTGKPISNTIANSMDLSGNHDLSYLASKYPGQAWAKNNNPAGLTWGISNELKQMLLDAGVSFGEGGKRPAGEGGAYIKFNSIEDGLKAYQISLTQRGDDVYSRLYSWSAGGDNSTPEATKLANKQSYANGLMKQAGIPQGAKFSQLSPEQLQKLMQAQIRRESPGLADILASAEFQQGKMTQAQGGTTLNNSVLQSTIANVTGKNTQCGVFVNDYLQKMGGSRIFGNSFADKMSKANASGGVGQVAIWQPTGGAAKPEFGHVAIITGDKGTHWEVTDTNWKGDGKVMTHDVPKNQIKGYYAPPQAKAGVSAEAKAWVDAWDKGTMDIETIQTKLGNSKEVIPLKNEIMQYIESRGGVSYRPATDPSVTSLKKKANEIDELLKNREQLENITGFIQMSPWDSLTGKKRDYLARVNNVLQTNVLQELIDAKAKGATFGALSDAELKMLQTMSSAAVGAAKIKDGKTIGYDITADEMERQLKLLRDGYLSNISRITGNNPNEQEQEQGSQPASQTGVGAINQQVMQNHSFLK